jgi:spore germination protein
MQLTAGQTLYLPRPLTAAEKKTIEANGYLLPQGTLSDANILRDTPSLTYVCMFSYQARADGTLVPPRDAQGLQAARQLNIAPLMTVTNFDGTNFNTELAHTLMANGSIRRRLIENIGRTMQQKGFRGVNVDFEHMRPSDRPLYNAFIRELGQAVRARGFFVSIAMGPKTSDDPQASWMGAFDYRTLGQEVDFLMLMTYEWGWVGGPPMAIAPLNQVRAVLEYATSVIPSEKILMGMALYGYDWPLPYPSGRRASGISNNSAQNLAIVQQVPIQWDVASQSPYFRYRRADGTEHEVWFDDAMSVLIKFQLIYDMNLRGVSYWVLGNEFPQAWYLMADTFQIRKV